MRSQVAKRLLSVPFRPSHLPLKPYKTQLAAMACNTPLAKVPQPVLDETWNNYQPGTRRPYGVMEWPALLRKLDRLDPGFRD